MSVQQFLAILRARRRLGLIVFFSTIALAVALSLLLPPRYTAEASVVVDIKPDPIAGMMYEGMMNPSVMATQTDILSSDRVTRRVIRDLKLDQRPEVRAQWQSDGPGMGTVEDWLVDALQKRLDVKPSKESNVILVDYKAPDPKLAAVLANAFVSAYLETVLELRVDPAKQYNSFFDQQTKDARNAVSEAQARLTAYQQQKGIVGDDERFDVETSRLNDLASQLVMQQALAAESTSRESQITGGNSDRMSEALSNPVVAGLKVDLARAQANLQELNSRLGASNPQVIQAKANIAELHARLNAELGRVAGGVGVTAKINSARLAEMRTALEAQRARVMELKKDREQVAVLQRDLDNAERNYETISSRQSQSKLESQTQQSNVSLLSPALPPIEPSFPKLLLNVLIAIFLGGLLGVAAMLIREMRDRRVRGSTDLVESLGLPIIGVMPRPAIKRRPSLMAQRVVSGQLAAPGKK
jgi:chain length determinant protein EpsF